jgi:hypothetical protein
VTIRRSNPHTLRAAIAAAQPPLFPDAILTYEDVREMAALVPPHFTQAVRSSYDVRALLDNQFVLWARPEGESIPSRGVKLDHKGDEEDQLLAATHLVRKLQRSHDVHLQISRAEEDQLVDLLVDHDRGMLTLYRCFKHNRKDFRRHALRYMHRKSADSSSAREEEIANERSGKRATLSARLVDQDLRLDRLQRQLLADYGREHPLPPPQQLPPSPRSPPTTTTSAVPNWSPTTTLPHTTPESSSASVLRTNQ